MTRRKAIARALVVAGAVVAVDQITKAIVRSSVGRGDAIDLALGFQLVNSRNAGVAFGFFSGGGALVAVVAGLALAALIAFFVTHADRRLVWLPTGLLIGGAAGNLIDRASEGSVTDFLDPPWWPAFNVADAAITVGVLVLLYVIEGPPSRGAARRA